MDSIRICCPKCNWEPDGQPYWMCTCGCMWDTFSTGGRCPGCGKVWEHTQCIKPAGGCPEWSPHLDWYENLDKVIEEVKEEIVKKEPVKILKNTNDKIQITNKIQIKNIKQKICDNNIHLTGDVS